jgi:hypothetical protein
MHYFSGPLGFALGGYDLAGLERKAVLSSFPSPTKDFWMSSLPACFIFSSINAFSSFQSVTAVCSKCLKQREELRDDLASTTRK